MCKRSKPIPFLEPSVAELSRPQHGQHMAPVSDPFRCISLPPKIISQRLFETCARAQAAFRVFVWKASLEGSLRGFAHPWEPGPWLSIPLEMHSPKRGSNHLACNSQKRIPSRFTRLCNLSFEALELPKWGFDSLNCPLWKIGLSYGCASHDH